MNTKQAKELMDNIRYRGLYWSVVYFLSPVTNQVECRTMLSLDSIEVTMWAKERNNEYLMKDIPCLIYVTGELEYFVERQQMIEAFHEADHKDS